MNRFLWAARGDVRRLKMAALLQFMLPGPPVIYYGTEVGVTQARDLEYPDGSRKPEESRTLMAWGAEQDSGLLSFYKCLIRYRTELRDRLATAPVFLPSGDPGVLLLSVGEGMFVAINRSPDVKAIDIPGESFQVALSTGEQVEADGETTTLPAMTGCLLLGR